jgi:hypothetical protein
VSAVVVVDVGGSHVKVLAGGEQESRRADSGPDLSAAQMVEAAKELADEWTWEQRLGRWVPSLGPGSARADHGLADYFQTAVEAGVPLPWARSHRRSPQSMQRGSTRRTITALPQAAHRNQPVVATPAGQNST